MENVGAGEGNRTLVISLEGCCSTIELHPRRGDSHRTSAIRSLAARMTDLCFSAMVGEVVITHARRSKRLRRGAGKIIPLKHMRSFRERPHLSEVQARS